MGPVLPPAEQFAVLVESSPNAIILAARGGGITVVNREAERLFGYRRDELIGLPVEVLVPERVRAGHVGLREGFTAHPTSRPMGAGRDLFARRKDGTEVPVEIGLTPVELPEGLFILATITDITERKRAEERLRRTTEELARSNAELQQFAYAASHDLQEPLRAVAGCTQLLRNLWKGKLDDTADQLITEAAEGAIRMQQLIDDLLAFSRVGTRGGIMERLESASVLEAALRNLSVAIRESEAEITHAPLPIVTADATQLVQLFQNLIGNALKFRGGERPRIHVGAERDGASWRFSVRDNGIGIAPEYLERIFAIFQRLHTRDEYPGTGIGLAICKRIVERHGGRIWAESQKGEGATFFFTLPDVVIP